MDPPVWTDCSHEYIDIGTRELAESTIIEDESRNIMCPSDLLEYIDINRVSCFIFLRGLDTECLEKKSLELFRRTDFDRSDEFIYLCFEFSDIRSDPLSDIFEFLFIESDSDSLHPSKHSDEI